MHFQSKLRLNGYEKKKCVWYLDKQPINHKFYFKRIKACKTRILLTKDKLGCSNFKRAWSSYSEKPWYVFECQTRFDIETNDSEHSYKKWFVVLEVFMEV